MQFLIFHNLDKLQIFFLYCFKFAKISHFSIFGLRYHGNGSPSQQIYGILPLITSMCISVCYIKKLVTACRNPYIQFWFLNRIDPNTYLGFFNFVRSFQSSCEHQLQVFITILINDPNFKFRRIKHSQKNYEIGICWHIVQRLKSCT